MKLTNHNFTLYEVETIQKEFETLLGNEAKIIIDLQEVKSIDMSGIQLLLSLKKSCDLRQKEFQVINVCNELISSFEITGTAYTLGV